MPLGRFARTAPDVVATALRQFGGGDPPAQGAITGWVLDQARPAPAEQAVLDVDLDDPWSRAGDVLVADARAAGPAGVVLTGPPDRLAVLTRTDLAERVRREVDVPVTVAAPAALRDDLAAALVSGRMDHVVLTEERS